MVDCEQQEGRTAGSLLLTMRVEQSVAEGAAQCCQRVLHGVGHVSIILPSPITPAGWIPGRSVQSLPVSSPDAAAPADHHTEDGCCHHIVSKGPQERPLQSNRPKSPRASQDLPTQQNPQSFRAPSASLDHLFTV